MDSDLLGQINISIAMVAKFIEVFGVLIIIVGGLIATITYINSYFRRVNKSYEIFRNSLGKAILLGLEFLVAGDIIGTVAVEPTFKNLGVLGLIVIIRTFLSFSLEVEIKGRWPWNSEKPQNENG